MNVGQSRLRNEHSVHDNPTALGSSFTDGWSGHVIGCISDRW